MNFWKLEGAKMSKRPARFGKLKQQPIICGSSLQMSVAGGSNTWRLVTGTSSGDLVVFDYETREAVSNVEKAHEGAVLSMTAGGADRSFLVTGGRDQRVRIWNQGLQPVSEFDLSKVSFADGSVAAVDVMPPECRSDSGGASTAADRLTILVGT